MGNKLGIYQRTDPNHRENVVVNVENDGEEHNNSDVENTQIDDPRTPEPSPHISSWKTPDVLPAIDMLKSQHILALIDPRSPNQEISRTPIVVPEDEANGKRKIDTSNNFLKVNQTMNQMDTTAGSQYTTPETVVLAFDPRSPTQDFDRTPIGVMSKKEALRNRSSKFEVTKQLHLKEN